MRIYRFLLAVLLLIVICQLNCYADETITITTYYPSPYGSYNQLQVGSGTKQAAILDVEGGTATSGNGLPINLYAQSGASVGSGNGGNIILMPGTATGSGTAGNVGIGTASPGQMLQIGNGTQTSIGLRINPNGVNWDLLSDGSGNLNIANGNGNYLTFLKSSIKVGIGTASPQGALDVNGTQYNEVVTQGYVLCFTAAHQLGHCTIVTASSGACTCVAN